MSNILNEKFPKMNCDSELLASGVILLDLKSIKSAVQTLCLSPNYFELK